MGTYIPDSEILQFLHDRMVYVHDENFNYDYMGEFRRIIDEMRASEQGRVAQPDAQRNEGGWDDYRCSCDEKHQSI